MSGLSNLGQTDTSLASSSSVTASAMEGIAGRAVASAGVDSLLQGTSFGQGLIDSTVSDASALGAFAIGDARVSGAFGSGVGGELGYVGSHALLGCAAGAATGAGCGGQAIGAAVSGLTANGIATLVTGGQGVNGPGQLAAITTATTLLGAGAAAALGQNPNAAVTGASNETLDNSAKHWIFTICMICNIGPMQNFFSPNTENDIGGGMTSMEDIEKINSGNEIQQVPESPMIQLPPK
jgi:filamentous hemagglutinin